MPSGLFRPVKLEGAPFWKKYTVGYWLMLYKLDVVGFCVTSSLAKYALGLCLRINKEAWVNMGRKS